MDADRRVQGKDARPFRMGRQQHVDGFVTQIDDACAVRVRPIGVWHDGLRLPQALVEIESDYGVVDADGPVSGDQQAQDFARVQAELGVQQIRIGCDASVGWPFAPGSEELVSATISRSMSRRTKRSFVR